MAGGHLTAHFDHLLSNQNKSSDTYKYAAEAYKEQSYVWGIFRAKETLEIAVPYSLGPIALYVGAILLYFACNDPRRRRRWIGCAVAIVLSAAGLGAFFLPIYWQDACEKYNDCQSFQHISQIVPQFRVGAQYIACPCIKKTQEADIAEAKKLAQEWEGGA
jgi:hypothetical protein